MRKIISILGVLCALTVCLAVCPAHASTNTTTVATITVTNMPTGTNGTETLMVYFNGNTNGYLYTWTNAVLTGFHQLAATNTVAGCAANLYAKLAGDWRGRLVVTQPDATNVVLQSYVNGQLAAAISTGWGALSVVTNGLGTNAALSISNLIAQSITLGGTAITNWSEIQGNTNLFDAAGAAQLSTSNLGNTIPAIQTNMGNKFYGTFTGTNVTSTSITNSYTIQSSGGAVTNLTLFGTTTNMGTIQGGAFAGNGAGLTNLPPQTNNLSISTLTTNFNIPSYQTNWTVMLPGLATNTLLRAELFIVSKIDQPYGTLMASNTLISTRYVAGQTYLGCPPFSEALAPDGSGYLIGMTGDNMVSFQDIDGSPLTFTASQMASAFEIQAQYVWTK